MWMIEGGVVYRTNAQSAVVVQPGLRLVESEAEGFGRFHLEMTKCFIVIVRPFGISNQTLLSLPHDIRVAAEPFGCPEICNRNRERSLRVRKCLEIV